MHSEIKSIGGKICRNQDSKLARLLFKHSTIYRFAISSGNPRFADDGIVDG